MKGRKHVLALEPIRKDGDWTLWRFVVEPRTLRYLWIFKGQFPAPLFHGETVLSVTEKHEKQAMEDRLRWKRYTYDGRTP